MGSKSKHFTLSLHVSDGDNASVKEAFSVTGGIDVTIADIDDDKVFATLLEFGAAFANGYNTGRLFFEQQNKVSGLNGNKVGTAPEDAPTDDNADPFRGKSHGLLQPNDETEKERYDRIAAEFARQAAYNAGLHGVVVEAPELQYNEIELSAYKKGKAENAMFTAGFTDGERGAEKDVNLANLAPYEIGYSEGKNKARHA